MFTDIVGSVDLKTRFGDSEAAKLIGRHDELFKREVGASPNAEILKDTGDGFLAQFATTSDAVVAALRFQYALHVEPWDGEPVRVRIGLHLGEVSELDEETPGRPKLSGLAVDLAARIMGLAMPGQILLTRAAFDSARQYVRKHPRVGEEDERPPLRWMAHGPYMFQGSEEAMEVFEVGAQGIAPLSVPVNSEKAQRSVEAEEEETLGWRPGSGLGVPGRDGWVLERHLGEGGFGEVWLAVHKRTGARRVFKFCYDVEKLRSFKRELAIVRLLRETLGDRPDIARMYEVRLDDPPFYLESEYTSEGSLVDWASRQEGGVGGIPLPTRLDLVARVADAVAAAHSVGVLHKDLKPDNILIYLSEEGLPRPQLSDFGIGRVVDYAKIKGDGINLSGVDSALLDDSDETHTGTLIYAPPETLAGKPFTIQGDVYELGILLYQMVVGDLERPLAHGWERNVPDALLRGDIAECVAGDELMRLASAKELAERLRTLPKRRRAARRKHVTRLTALSTVLLAALLTIVTAYLWQERTLRLRAEVAEQQAKNEESKAKAINAFILRALGSADPTKDGFDVTVAEVLSDAASEINTSFPDQPLVRAELRNTIGKTLKELGLFNEAAQQHRLALEVRREEFPPGSPEIAESLKELADALWFDGNYEEAEPLYRESLELRKAEYGEESAEYAEILNNLAACLQGLDRHDEAVRSYEESLAIRRRVLEGEARHLVAAGLNNLGMCLSAQGKYDDAEERYREALDVITEVKGEDHFGVGVTMTNLASCLVEQGSYDEAERLYERAMEIKVERAGPDHHRVAVVLNGLAKLHLRQDALEEAEGFSREALDVLVRGELRRTHERYGDTLTLMGDILIHGGKAEEAESSIREALDIRRNARPQIEWKIAETESILGECLSELGEYDEAERLLERSFPAIEKHHGLAHGATQRAIDRMIAHYRATGQQDQMQRYVAMRNGGRGG